MAYARMGADGSQVYIYLAREGFHCCMCSLPAYCWSAKSPYFETAQAARDSYREQGAIYGDTHEGMMRWLRELSELDQLRAKADLILERQQMLRDLAVKLRL